mmetsp:Transcript_69198/g.165929  ORF Transcript_69198/g.165929 Transcript_69198/m.165929 type:complete len:227 (-) Transcript_69198:160-840(-)|eukprot:CAMPEP_0178421714 /NCGR_PEP_ID=MMETSP0689_2-20121128/26790_1 /TAXON_ID=160604 /ORGANISM="Amphidinium massartii, Strain CS-259" /LENGTH=226 /DNA_ID=CAMNT_0020043235 /DNA_START=132 /DNA_END=812 /DNA_ORIENTATION=-
MGGSHCTCACTKEPAKPHQVTVKVDDEGCDVDGPRGEGEHHLRSVIEPAYDQVLANSFLQLGGSRVPLQAANEPPPSLLAYTEPDWRDGSAIIPVVPPASRPTEPKERSKESASAAEELKGATFSDKQSSKVEVVRKFRFEVCVERPPGANLGLSIDWDPSLVLHVEAVKPGLIADWNEAHPGEEVESGCIITAVNGVSGDVAAMLDFIDTAPVIQLEVKRPDAPD